ncbi:Uma2 family endonuclease [Streptomyces sp. 4503]|uniref:Uma2 family endonuclease n=1 Tax=Streptomyces niphimycinicus TaxID=2842201 RepID=A0ABS6CNT5_9ACTN|nr:Uma2 family endonuclease [Streptomyces niphimycinicus]MBU3868489.1 Uma2 family endonuclease [Streptomyces niphimycinicus]
MTAEPLHTTSWPVPPLDGYTVDDLLSLPDLPPHTELIDGSLVFVGPQRYFHSLAIDLLVSGLRRTAPPELRIAREMTVVIDKRNGPEPDITVMRAEAVRSRVQTSFEVGDVILAVEVVSPESEARDHDTKPHKYANAGIQHFWRVEMTNTDARAVVHVFELDEERRVYRSTGIHHDHLKLSVPFTIDIDLTEIDHL